MKIEEHTCALSSLCCRRHGLTCRLDRYPHPRGRYTAYGAYAIVQLATAQERQKWCERAYSLQCSETIAYVYAYAYDSISAACWDIMCGKRLFVGLKKHIAAMQSDVSMTANVVPMGYAWI
jgi:hypothetical protein